MTLISLSPSVHDLIDYSPPPGVLVGLQLDEVAVVEASLVVGVFAHPDGAASGVGGTVLAVVRLVAV